jgi:1-acyl-sn-glycerol-3-phosphate acyltransferase
MRVILRAIFRPIFRLFFRIKIEGKENIPMGQPYLLACNHVSLLEPPMLLSFWPEKPEALAGHDVWDRPGQGILVKGWGAIPVKRGEYDRIVIDKMVAVLRSGRPLMIYPEGGRSHEPKMRRAWPGVAYLVDKADVPVLPVAVIGTSDELLKDLFKFNRNLIRIKIGEPFRLPPITEKGEARRQARQRNADMVMHEIGKLLPASYHGVYEGEIPES